MDIGKIVSDFAGVLGTTPEHLLEIGAQYKLAQAYGDLFVGICAVIISVLAAGVTYKYLHSDSGFQLISGFIAVVSMGCGSANIYSAIVGIMSPQGVLLKDIIGKVIRLY